MLVTNQKEGSCNREFNTVPKYKCWDGWGILEEAHLQ